MSPVVGTGKSAVHFPYDSSGKGMKAAQDLAKKTGKPIKVTKITVKKKK